MSAEKNLAVGRRGPGRLSAEQTAELPDRLLDAALQLFTERGFAATTMEQVAKQAGASTKTLYSRHENKADLLKAVVLRIVEQSLAAHNAAMPPDPRDIDPRLFLQSLFTQMSMRIATEGAGLNRLALAEGHRVPALRELYRAVTGRGAGIVQHALEQWRADGRLPWLDDPARAAVLCMSMCVDPTRIMTALGDPPGLPEIQARIAFSVDLFLRSCGYQPSIEAIQSRHPPA
jgi:AcrR family transcriptional regulator